MSVIEISSPITFLSLKVSITQPSKYSWYLDGSVVKIADFNVSKFSEEDKKSLYTGLSNDNYKMWTYTGTIAFTAPEVFTDTEYT